MGTKVSEDAEVIIGDIVDLEVTPLESDTPITEAAKETEKKVEKEKAEEDEQDAEEILDEEEVVAEESEEESEQEEKKEPETKAKNVVNDAEIVAIQREIQQASNLVKNIAKSLPEEPKRPDPDDDEAMAQYRVDIAVYKSQKAQLQMQHENARTTAEQLCQKQEQMFRKSHAGEDLEAFEAWMRDSVELQSAFVTGKKTLNTLFKWYQSEVGEPEKDKKTLAEIKKKGLKIVPVSTKGGGKAVSGGNGFDPKFKYANLPEFKDFVKQYKGKVSDITGERYTHQYIDNICKTQYKESRGIPII